MKLAEKAGMSPAHVPEELISRLPLPLARLCRNAVNEEPSLGQYLAGYCLWEAGLKLLASAALAACARRKPPIAPEAAELTTLARPMLGHWRKYVRELLPELVAAGVSEFAPAHDAFRRGRADMPHAARLDLVLSRLLKGESDLDRALTPAPGREVKLDDLFDRLVSHRNRHIGHGAVGMSGTPYYETLSPILLAGVVEVVGRVCVPPDVRMVHVTRVERVKPDRWAVHRFDLTGETPKRLDPLLLPPDAAAHLPFCDRVYREPQPEYLCYTDNRTLRRADLRLDHQSFLGDLFGRAVPAPAAGALGAILFALLDAASAPPGLSLEAIRAAYHASAPRGWEVVASSTTPTEALAAYCRDLARCPLQAGVSPLVTFARTLAPRCPSEFTEMLNDAIRSASESVGETAPPPSQPLPPPVPQPAAGTATTAEPSYLLIAIRAAMSDPGHYEVKGWLSAGRETVYLEAGEERHTREQLPGVVDRLRGLAEAHPVARGSLWVEFLLPRDLIPVAVDQWGVTVEDEL